MQTRFVASEFVRIDIPDESVPIQQYLQQPHRLVYALFDPSRIDPLTDNRFRLKMRSLKFSVLNVQPIVDIQVRARANGRVSVWSTGCEIRGVEYFNRRFNLTLAGSLYPLQRNGQTQLEGRADLDVQVELPPALWFTPKWVLEKTGDSILKGILSTIKHRLELQLLADYRKWADSTDEAEATNLFPGIPANPPTA